MDQATNTSPRSGFSTCCTRKDRDRRRAARAQWFLAGPSKPSASTLSETGAAADSYCGGTVVSGTVVAGGGVVAAGANTTCPAFS